jgi:alcohol dehydrogenase (cytochrome c)
MVKPVRWWIATAVLAATGAAQVTHQRIAAAGDEAQNWLTYSGNYQGHRFSGLKQIDTSNVGKLRPAWVFQMDLTYRLQTSPLVVDGVMYLTEPPSNAIALDARSGRPFWRYKRPLVRDVTHCCGHVNRGMAILGDTLFLGTIEAHMVALDARTGIVRWDRTMDAYKGGYSSTGAPLAIPGKVISGIAGGEFGARGFLDSYDPENGQRLWRLYTVPAAGEPGVETWKGDSWRTGGGPTWLTGTYDPVLKLLYWGTGNPAADFNNELRDGDNLYTNSLLAVDPETGRRKWHFQFTPNDVFDWDATEVPVLVDAPFDGNMRKLVVMANRNGFYYVLDRQTGQFLRGVPFATQNWAKGLDPVSGRPVSLGLKPSAGGTLVFPEIDGATNWFSPSYHPGLNLFYVSAREAGGLAFKGDPNRQPNLVMVGGSWQKAPARERWGAVRALKVDTGEKVWEFKLQQPPWAGILSTAGGLVFSGTEDGDFFALDAANGKLLWHFATGGRINANPISYSVGGKQFVAIASGQAMFAFALE